MLNNLLKSTIIIYFDYIIKWILNKFVSPKLQVSEINLAGEIELKLLVCGFELWFSSMSDEDLVSWNN